MCLSKKIKKYIHFRMSRHLCRTIEVAVYPRAKVVKRLLALRARKQLVANALFLFFSMEETLREDLGRKREGAKLKVICMICQV